MIALGTPVAYSQVAYVVRKRNDIWFVPSKGNFSVPSIVPAPISSMERGVIFRMPQHPGSIYHIDVRHLVALDTFGSRSGLINKSVGAVFLSGSGIVVDRVQRRIGVSEDAGDCGFFNPHGSVWLYVVKSSYGEPCAYVPEDSIIPFGLLTFTDLVTKKTYEPDPKPIKKPKGGKK